MQAWTQSLNFWVAAVEPSPWSHLAAHLLVSTTCAVLGWADPIQAAWQSTSPAGQVTRQLCWGVKLADATLTGALVMVDPWGAARTLATRARMTVEYFILMVRTGCR